MLAFSSKYSTTREFKGVLSPLGFSLLEILITLSLVGLAVTLAVPQFTSASNRLALRSEANSLRLFIERFGAYSLASKLQVNLKISSDSLSATIKDGQIIGTHSIKRGAQITLPMTNGASSSITLYPSISASPTTLVLSRRGSSCSIIISLRARVRTVC